MATRTHVPVTETPLQIDTDGVTLSADLALPAAPTGLVLFAHGSGSSRHSPRNRHVAQALQAALRQLPAEKRLEIVPGATHLFEEPGTLEQVAALARDWFVQHLQP